jgi:S-formylglutathione hydrolase FrmB
LSEQSFTSVELSDPRFERAGVRHATVYSSALGRRADCTFWSPPGLTTSPTHLIVLLHGVYAGHWAWLECGGAHQVAQELVASGDVGSFGLAMPSDGMSGYGTGYVTTNDGNVERWIIDEVPALAAMALPGIDPDQAFSIIGLSMGGFGALSLGALYGDRLHAVAGMSSITDFSQMEIFVGSLDRYVIDNGRRSVLGSILAHRDRLPKIRIDCGTDDLLVAQNRQLHEALCEHGIAHSWNEYPGAHEWAYWHAHLGEAIRFCCAA